VRPVVRRLSRREARRQDGEHTDARRAFHVIIGGKVPSRANASAALAVMVSLTARCWGQDVEVTPVDAKVIAGRFNTADRACRQKELADAMPMS